MHGCFVCTRVGFFCSFLRLTLVLNGVKTNTLKVLLHYFTISLKKKKVVRKRGLIHLNLKDKTRETLKTKQNNKKKKSKEVPSQLSGEKQSISGPSRRKTKFQKI